MSLSALTPGVARRASLDGARPRELHTAALGVAVCGRHTWPARERCGGVALAFRCTLLHRLILQSLACRCGRTLDWHDFTVLIVYVFIPAVLVLGSYNFHLISFLSPKGSRKWVSQEKKPQNCKNLNTLLSLKRFLFQNLNVFY